MSVLYNNSQSDDGCHWMASAWRSALWTAWWAPGCSSKKDTRSRSIISELAVIVLYVSCTATVCVLYICIMYVCIYSICIFSVCMSVHIVAILTLCPPYPFLGYRPWSAGLGGHAIWATLSQRERARLAVVLVVAATPCRTACCLPC